MIKVIEKVCLVFLAMFLISLMVGIVGIYLGIALFVFSIEVCTDAASGNKYDVVYNKDESVLLKKKQTLVVSGGLFTFFSYIFVGCCEIVKALFIKLFSRETKDDGNNLLDEDLDNEDLDDEDLDDTYSDIKDEELDEESDGNLV